MKHKLPVEEGKKFSILFEVSFQNRKKREIFFFPTPRGGGMGRGVRVEQWLVHLHKSLFIYTTLTFFFCPSLCFS
jgi:hypothetical protein